MMDALTSKEVRKKIREGTYWSKETKEVKETKETKEEYVEFPKNIVKLEDFFHKEIIKEIVRNCGIDIKKYGIIDAYLNEIKSARVGGIIYIFTIEFVKLGLKRWDFYISDYDMSQPDFKLNKVLYEKFIFELKKLKEREIL